MLAILILKIGSSLRDLYTEVTETCAFLPHAFNLRGKKTALSPHALRALTLSFLTQIF